MRQENVLSNASKALQESRKYTLLVVVIKTKAGQDTLTELESQARFRTRDFSLGLRQAHAARMTRALGVRRT